MNIAAPLLFGQALAYAATGRASLSWLAFVGIFGVVDQLFIVFANDYADRETDGPERTPFSGGSGVLVEGLITADALRRAALLMAAALLVMTASVAPSRPLLLPMSLAAIGLMYAYSSPPLSLSSRPIGALAQAIGVGAVLPFVGFYAQSGRVDLPLPALATALLAGLGGNLMTAVPDVDADARVGKRTAVVAAGERAGVVGAVACLALALGVALGLGGAPSWLTVLLAPLAAALFVGTRRGGDARRRRVLFVLLGGAAQHGLLLGWALALALP